MSTAARPQQAAVGPAALPGAVRSARGGFEGYRDGLTHSWLRTLTALGFTLYPLFFILDYFTMPEQLLPRFALYRGLVTVVVLLQYFWVRRTRPSRYSYLHGYVFSALTAGGIVQMTVDLGGFESAYYAGLNLVIVATNLVLPWRAIHTAVNGFIVLTLYVVANAVFGADTYEASDVINNLYFMGATVVIAVAITYTKHQLIQKEYSLRAELLEVNENLERSRVALKEARDALWGEMEVAKRIQTALLPRNRKLGGYEAAAVMHPAAEVGGDYYDFIETAAGDRWVTIGDVSGHGVEAGLVMMMTQTSILTLVNQNPDLSPAEVFQIVNGVLRENISRLQASRYMTLNLLRVEKDRLTVAGKHQDILVYRRADRKVDVFENEGVWIGVVPDAKGLVKNEDIPLFEGDTVLLYTDGVTEATSDGGEMYGVERLAEAFREVAERPLEEALQTLHQQIMTFGPRQEDDITLVLLRRLPV